MRTEEKEGTGSGEKKNNDVLVCIVTRKYTLVVCLLLAASHVTSEFGEGGGGVVGVLV